MANEHSTNAQSQIESLDDFEDDKAGQYQRWNTEFEASYAASKKWRKRGHKTVAKFSADRSAAEEQHFRLNLFPANIKTTSTYFPIGWITHQTIK